MSGTERDGQQTILVVKVSKGLIWFELAFVLVFLIIMIVLLPDVEFRGGHDALEWELIAAGIMVSCVMAIRQLKDRAVLFERRVDGIQSGGLN